MFIGIIVICLLYIVVVWIFKGKYSVYSRKQLVSEAQNNAKIIDFLSGALTTKLYRAEKFSYKSIEKSFTAYLENIYKLGKLENIQYALKDLIGLSGEIVILCLGAYNIFLGDMLSLLHIFSQFETACLLTFSFMANCSCVNFSF